MSHFCFHEPKRSLVLKAKTRRPTTRTYRRVELLSKQMQSAVKVNLVKGIKSFKSKVSEEALLKAWKTGSYGHIMETLPWNDLPVEIDRVGDPLRNTAFKSSLISVEALPHPVQRGLRYDVKNPELKRFIDKRTGSLVNDISNDTQKIIQQSVTRSFQEALRPDQVAKAIKGNIGLLPRHALAVDNYRVALEKQGFAPDRVDALTGGYQDRLLTLRANTIARTETRFASNFGQLSVWKEAASQDLIDRDSAKKVWMTDGAPCEICDPMDGIGVPLDGQWTLNNGDIVDIPTESHPNCMCGMELDFGDGTIADQEEE